jgi:hypothetical protein
VRDPLPDVSVPLDPGVPDVMLSLRQCLDRVYADSRYAEDLNYAEAPNPPLRGPDAIWARELIAARQQPAS